MLARYGLLWGVLTVGLNLLILRNVTSTARDRNTEKLRVDSTGRKKILVLEDKQMIIPTTGSFDGSPAIEQFSNTDFLPNGVPNFTVYVNSKISRRNKESRRYRLRVESRNVLRENSSLGEIHRDYSEERYSKRSVSLKKPNLSHDDHQINDQSHGKNTNHSINQTAPQSIGQNTSQSHHHNLYRKYNQSSFQSHDQTVSRNRHDQNIFLNLRQSIARNHEQMILQQLERQIQLRQSDFTAFDTKIPTSVDLSFKTPKPAASAPMKKPTEARGTPSQPISSKVPVSKPTITHRVTLPTQPSNPSQPIPSKVPVSKPTISHRVTLPTQPTTAPIVPTVPHWLPTATFQPTPAQSCQSDIDLAFMIEASKSIANTGYHNYKFLKNFVKNVVLKFVISPKYTRVGLLTYANRPYLHLGLFGGSTIPRILEVLSGPSPVKHTAWSARTGWALAFALRSFFGCYCGPKSKRKKVLVVVTDGRSIDDVYWPAKALKDSGIKIVCVGVGRYFNISQLNDMASPPAAKNVFTGDFSKIHHVINELVKQICEGSNGSLVPTKSHCPCK